MSKRTPRATAPILPQAQTTLPPDSEFSTFENGYVLDDANLSRLQDVHDCPQTEQVTPDPSFWKGGAQ